MAFCSILMFSIPSLLLRCFECNDFYSLHPVLLISEILDSLILFYIKLFVSFFSFWAVLSLCCCSQAFSTCGKQELHSWQWHELLVAVTSLVGRMGSQAWASVAVGHGLSCSIICEIFLDQRWNPVRCTGRQILYPLVHLDRLTLCDVLLLFLWPLVPESCFLMCFVSLDCEKSAYQGFICKEYYERGILLCKMNAFLF